MLKAPGSIPSTTERNAINKDGQNFEIKSPLDSQKTEL